MERSIRGSGGSISQPWSVWVSEEKYINKIYISTALRQESEKSNLTSKPRRDFTKSPTQGYQWPHVKDLCLPKIYFKKDCIHIISFEPISKRLTSKSFHELSVKEVWTNVFG